MAFCKIRNAKRDFVYAHCDSCYSCVVEGAGPAAKNLEVYFMKTIEDEFREMPELPETAPAELDVAFSWQDESDTESLDDEADLPRYDSDWSPSVYPSNQYERHRERPILDQLVSSLKREAQLERQLQCAQDKLPLPHWDVPMLKSESIGTLFCVILLSRMGIV